MKKIIFLIFVSTLAKFSYPQKDTISAEIEFKKFVYQCIDSLIKKEMKYNSIVGIKMELNLNGEVDKYDLTFKNKDEKFRRRDYKWLLYLLNQKNYKNVAKRFYSPEDLKTAKSMKVSIKYIGLTDR
jgi:hypothetical protein